MAAAIGDHAGLGTIGLCPAALGDAAKADRAATRSAKCLARRASSSAASFRRHWPPSGAQGCRCRPGRSCPVARHGPAPSSAGAPIRRRQTADQISGKPRPADHQGQMKVCATIHQEPNSFGRLRYFAPFWQRQMIASTVCPRSSRCVVRCGRPTSIKGDSTAHRASVSTRVIASPVRSTSSG